MLIKFQTLFSWVGKIKCEVGFKVDRNRFSKGRKGASTKNISFVYKNCRTRSIVGMVRDSEKLLCNPAWIQEIFQ